MGWSEKMPCPVCDSSDAYSISDNGWGKCFSCYENIHPSKASKQAVQEDSIITSRVVPMPVRKPVTEPPKPLDLTHLKHKAIVDRNISISTAERYGVGYIGTDLVFPYGKAAKIRKQGEKNFTIKGDWKAYKGLFGQERFSAGGKMVVITEGEIDAMSASQMLEGRYPVVSVRNGAQAAYSDCKHNFEFLDSFDTIYISFDMDEPGIEASKNVAELFAKKAKIVKLPNGFKDANDMLVDNKAKEYSIALWRGEQYSPVGIVHLDQMWDSFANEDANTKIPFPDSWATLNQMMCGGAERGEVTVIGALTSIGKSSIVSNLVYHWMENTDFRTGVMYLEGTQREVVRDLLSLDLSMNLRRTDRSKLDMEKLEEHWHSNIASKDNFIFVDHRGSLSNDSILSKLNYLAKGMECDIIIIDPIQAAVDASDNGQVIQFMDMLLKFAKETDTAVFIVSHMRKPDGNDPHAVSEYHLLGSSSINQIAFNTILLSRDKMTQDLTKKNATKLHLPKCRRTGDTGVAGWLRYDVNTTHMYAMADPYEVVL